MKQSFGDYLINLYGENAIKLYWGESNEISPFDVSCGSHIKIYINCQEKEYHKEYETEPCNFKRGRRCPYCKGRKTHPKDSFAQWGIDNFGDDFLDVFVDKEFIEEAWKLSPSSNKKINFKCVENKEHGVYKMQCNDFKNEHRCPYCSSNKFHIVNSFGYKYRDFIKLYSVDNEKTPFEITIGSRKKVKWVCNDCDTEYYKTISNAILQKFRCPECVRLKETSLSQEATENYLSEIGYKTLHEHNCNIIPKNPKSKHCLPFDNEVVDLKLIIEVHGQQHYEVQCNTSRWLKDKTPEEYLKYRKLLDRYKKFIAYKNGYEYLELPYWCFEDDSYKKLIDDKIKCIKEKKER